MIKGFIKAALMVTNYQASDGFGYGGGDGDSTGYGDGYCYGYGYYRLDARLRLAAR